MEKIILDELKQESVSVKKQKYVNVDGTDYPIGDLWRKAYMNTEEGRKELEKELDDKYVNAVFAIWGDNLTIE